MKCYIFFATFVAAAVIIESSHLFMGTSVLRQQVYHRDVKYSSKLFQKRVERLNFTLPKTLGHGRSIQGILAYDKSNSDSSANVTAGGLGYNFLNLRFKSGRGDRIDYDVYVYA